MFEDEDRIQQADLFYKWLRKAYFTISSAHSIPLAATESWEDFMKIAWDECSDGNPASDSVLCTTSLYSSLLVMSQCLS